VCDLIADRFFDSLPGCVLSEDREVESLNQFAASLPQHFAGIQRANGFIWLVLQYQGMAFHYLRFVA
jgi:hypothetical protein